ncbi:hypothetical protein Micbo1qcDRAFT_180639 [Microdochium bolleyi]|uniref:Uncharacterized protein n=1 Tax=Microdochium bolleyi TaxID=196109 RepID=A0A136ILZ2_9PEZI|nr:hypothetical protein Micbo1qcDRAFT_180639 [Microdochium bolleyi]
MLMGRPPCPYKEGFTLQLRPHQPPPAIYSRDTARQGQHAEWWWIIPSRWKSPESSPEIKTGRPSQRVVAKIYDPLYYSISQRPDSNLTHAADSHYPRKEAVYEHLDAQEHGGEFTPTYHGSWTFDFPTSHPNVPGVHRRAVRAVNMDWVDGESLDDVNEVLRNKLVFPAPVKRDDAGRPDYKAGPQPPLGLMDIDFERWPADDGDERPENPIDRRWPINLFGGDKKALYRPVKCDTISLSM